MSQVYKMGTLLVTSTSQELARAEAWTEFAEKLEEAFGKSSPLNSQTAEELYKSIQMLKIATTRWKCEAALDDGLPIFTVVDFYPDI